MSLERTVVVALFTLCACRPAGAQPAPSKLEGMWSNPPTTAIGSFCASFCTDAGIDRLNALLDDPANDSRPFAQLLTQALNFQTGNYIKPRLSAAALQRFPLDDADDPGLLRCEPWGLARQMFARHQLEIRRRGSDRIELHYGEWDARRTVYMNATKPPADLRPSRLGYSTGRWDGDTLVVETSGVAKNWTTWRAEHSDQMRVVERFTRSDKDNTLHLTATIEDAWGLKEPLVMKKIWAWSPKSIIAPYDACQPVTAVKKGTNTQ